MSYLNDPRENAIREESGITLEADNRIEPMYHWGAMVLDLCGMDPEEYMKNPIVEAINGGSGGGGSDTGSTGGNDDIIEAINSATESINENITASTQQVVDAISSSTEDIVEAISSSTENMLDANSSSTETIVDAIDSAATTISDAISSSSTVSSEIVFYYASVNNMDSVSSADFTEAHATVGSNTNITFKLGNPSSDDWALYKNGTMNETDLRRRSANTFYLAVPSEFDGKFTVLENGSVDITDKFTHHETNIFSEYTTYQSVDEDYFNEDYDDTNTRVVGVAYKITFTK